MPQEPRYQAETESPVVGSRVSPMSERQRQRRQADTESPVAGPSGLQEPRQVLAEPPSWLDEDKIQFSPASTVSDHSSDVPPPPDEAANAAASPADEAATPAGRRVPAGARRGRGRGGRRARSRAAGGLEVCSAASSPWRRSTDPVRLPPNTGWWRPLTNASASHARDVDLAES